MLDGAIIWVLSRWLEVASLLIACAALFYAHLAYRSSVEASADARAAALANLRIAAKAGLGEAQRSLLTLETNCQASRAEWERHEHRHLPALGRKMPVLSPSPTGKVEAQGRRLLGNLSQSYAAVEIMTSGELEKLLQEASTTSLQIQALTGQLEAPPIYLTC